MIKKWGFPILFVVVVLAQSGTCQEKNSFRKLSLGIEFGTWKPNNLRTTGTPFTLSFSPKYQYIGFFCISPVSENLHLRATLGYYNYYRRNNNASKQSIYLIPFLADLKYFLISGSRICPYVSYGVGAFIGAGSASRLFSFGKNSQQIGYGLNLGTGFDFLVTRHIAIGLEFRYHYLKFSEVLVFTDDYSGPKINLTIFYIM